MSIYQFIYISDAKTATSSADLSRLVLKCEAKNRRFDLTGLLLYSGGHFIQLLEGPERSVETVFWRIERDPRHHNIQRLYGGPSQGRLFPNWRMGLLNVGSFTDLDRSRFEESVLRLRQHPDGATISNVFREFRSQLPCPVSAQVRAA